MGTNSLGFHKIESKRIIMFFFFFMPIVVFKSITSLNYFFKAFHFFFRFNRFC
jgi:hypothetical protein